MQDEILPSHQRDEILTFISMEMELGSIMLSKMSQSKTDNYHIVLLMKKFRHTHKKQILLRFHLHKVLRIITVISESRQGGGY